MLLAEGNESELLREAYGSEEEEEEAEEEEEEEQDIVE